MRWQELAPGDDRRLDGHWVPVIGEVVCVHPGGDVAYNFLARVRMLAGNRHEDYRRFRILPLFASRTNMRDAHTSMLEPTRLTFRGHACVRCKKGQIR